MHKKKEVGGRRVERKGFTLGQRAGGEESLIRKGKRRGASISLGRKGRVEKLLRGRGEGE